MDELSQYLDSPVDYSQSFTDRVGRLRAELSDLLHAELSHDDDMNYNAGQKIGLCLRADGSITTDARAAVYSLGIWIASRGPLWTRILHCGQDGDLVWRPCPLAKLQETPRGSALLDTIEGFLQDKGLSLVPDATLAQMADAKETEMDGAPATVRDVLFCEIC